MRRRSRNDMLSHAITPLSGQGEQVDQVHKVAHEGPLGDNEEFGEGTKSGVAVCVITYRRPEGLRRLLGALDDLIFKKSEVPDIKIVVVDNDPAGSALAVCEDMAPALKWPIEYRTE